MQEWIGRGKKSRQKAVKDTVKLVSSIVLKTSLFF